MARHKSRKSFRRRAARRNPMSAAAGAAAFKATSSAIGKASKKRAARNAKKTRSAKKSSGVSTAARARAGRKAAKTRKLNAAKRSAAARKAAKTRKVGRKPAKRTVRKGRRRARYTAAPARRLRKVRGKSGRVRRKLSRRGRSVMRRPSGTKLRKSLRRAGRKYTGAARAAAYKRSWRRKPGRRVARGLSTAYRGVTKGGRFRRVKRGAGSKTLFMTSRRNPSLGGLKEVLMKTVLAGGVAYLGIVGAKALSNFITAQVSARVSNPTVARVLGAAGGVAVPLGAAIALYFVRSKVAKLQTGKAKDAVDAVMVGLGIVVAQRLVSAFVTPMLPATTPEYLRAALSSDDPGALYDAAGAPITREWGRYVPVQGYYGDNGSDLPTNGMGDLMAAPAGMGLLAANAGIGRYISAPGPVDVGQSGMGEYVRVQGLGDGSYVCPHCGAQGHAPSGAAAFKCWSCQNAVSGLGDGLSGQDDLSVVGPMQRPGGIFGESVFGTVTASS